MIPPSDFGWFFCKPIILLVVHLPTFLWLSVGVFSELIGVFYLTLLLGLFFAGTTGSSISFLFSTRCKSSYILGYRIAAHCLLQSIGVF